MPSKKAEQETPSHGRAPDHAPVAGAMPDTLFAGMDHQIHTSMNGVIGMLELLRGTDLTPSQREFTDMAQSSAENLLRLFDGMLDFARLSAGTLLLDPLPFDVLREVESAIAMHRAAADRKGLAVEVQAAADAQRLMIGDANRIGHVMATLIGNAVEHTAAGTVRISVESIAQQDGRCRLCLCVSDSGGDASGPEFAEIFSGARAISPADPRHGPMQLALAFCKNLIDLMGGQCGADSDPDGSHKFWFTLNLPLAASVLDGVRILVADDLPSTRRVLEQQLRQYGLRVDGFGSAAEVLIALGDARSAQDPYRIAVLNRQLADMGGELLGAAIKSDTAFESVLLVLLSAEPENAEHCMQSGFAAVIGKPVVQQVLLDTLAILCGCLNSRKAPPFVQDAVIRQPAQQAAQRSLFAGRRVLVADDDLSNGRIAARMLERLGCRADVATSGQQAVAMHDREPYDLILMDCQMPGMDGYQATAMIRATERGHRHTPLIAWTTTALQAERKKCAAAGMDDLVTKPTRGPELQELLARWLPGAGNADPAHATESDDLDAMQELFGASFVELAGLYRSDTPKRLEALDAALRKGDLAAMAKIVHSVSGSCASIGATRLAALCNDLELRCLAGEADGVAPRLGAIRLEYARIETKLQSMTQSVAV
jgi:CheY-like chemotaxis protein/HPt (histidine-containing phosphotransfer) domain-containing protein